MLRPMHRQSHGTWTSWTTRRVLERVRITCCFVVAMAVGIAAGVATGEHGTSNPGLPKLEQPGVGAALVGMSAALFVGLVMRIGYVLHRRRNPSAWVSCSGTSTVNAIIVPFFLSAGRRWKTPPGKASPCERGESTGSASRVGPAVDRHFAEAMRAAGYRPSETTGRSRRGRWTSGRTGNKRGSGTLG